MIRKIASTPLYVIVLINLVLKLGIFCYLSPWDKNIENTKVLASDSKGYEQVAENILHYHSFAPLKDTVDINNFSELRATGFIMCHPDGWMMPVYPVFLAGVYSIAGIKPYIAILIQIMLSLISVILIYRICTLLFQNTKIASIAALLFALDIHSVYSSTEMLTDTLFVLLFLAGIYYFLKGMTAGKLGIICVGALFMGLACLTRLLVLMYPVILLFVLLVFSEQNRKWKLQAIMSYIVIFAFLNGTWSFRNHSQYGHWELTAHGGWTLLMFNTSLTSERITHENIDSIRVAFQEQADSMGFRKSKDIFEQSEMYRKIASKYIMQHKGTYLLTNLQGCLNMFFSLGNMGMAKTFGWAKTGPSGNFAELTSKRMGQNFSSGKREALLGILIMLVLAVQYIGAVYGIIKLSMARNFIFVSLFILTVIYFAAITGVLGSYRFKLPLVPLICIAAGYGYYKMTEIWKSRKEPSIDIAKQ
jgi:4-amino-4-deoxy-L-arabinose transferase-like glycosyltransferase